MSLQSLTDDILLHILRQLGPEDMAKLGLTSRHWFDKTLHCPTGERIWKVFAQRRWGSAVSVGDDDGSEQDVSFDDDLTLPSASAWYRYYRHRCSAWLSRPSQISHLDLIQEQYASDPYRLLAACILCSRTSGGYTVRTTTHDFLNKYPTPTHVIEADAATMAKELHPLGLNRERTMKRFAEGFVQPWKEVNELHGCGAFASSSHQMFCLGDWKGVLKDKKADRNVKAYASFCRRLLADKGDDEAFEEETKEEAERIRLEKEKAKKKRKPPKVRKPLPKKRTMPTRRSPRAIIEA